LVARAVGEPKTPTAEGLLESAVDDAIEALHLEPEAEHIEFEVAYEEADRDGLVVRSNGAAGRELVEVA
jgi:hypothetical protein